MKLLAELHRIRKAMANADKAVERLSEQATYAAIDAATEATPPVMDDLRGVHTRTGALKNAWEEDSITEPKKVNGAYETHLKNNMQYASYVNNGHRMDKHFVPGLYINPYSGELEYDAQRKGEVGIVVGTRTTYVPGLFMAEKGEEAFGKFVDEMGGKVLKEFTG